MENRFTRFLYDHSPVFFQDVYSSFYGWRKNRARYGEVYRRMLAFFTGSADWSRAELEAYQGQKLCQIVRQAYEHAPFWRRRLDEARIRPDDVRRLEDLPKLPLLTKDDVRQGGSDMLADNYDRRTIFSHPTSGSTGMPVTLYTAPDALQTEFAFHWARRRPGITRRDRYASFAGLQIVRPGATRPPFWRNNWLSQQRMYSIFHMGEGTLGHYVRDLDAFGAVYWQGYPAAMYTIADYIERHGLRLANPPRAAFSTSEELQPVYRQTVERVLGTKVWEMYGQGEYIGSITEYPCGHMHYDMDYGILEFLDMGREDGLVKAELVCTGLYCHGWPLLRYRIGDIVLYDPDEPLGPQCRIQGPIIRKVFGRTGQFFVLPDGTRVGNISVIAKKCRNIITMQVVQEIAGEVEVLVQKAPAFEPTDEQVIRDMFGAKLGTDLKLHIRYVDKPLLTRSGKFLSIISRLNQGAPPPS